MDGILMMLGFICSIQHKQQWIEIQIFRDQIWYLDEKFEKIEKKKKKNPKIYSTLH